MEELVYYNELYLIYKNLLSKKMQDIFDLYYGENYTMQEIADLTKLSKARVGIVIKSVIKKLLEYENSLKLYAKKEKINNILKLNDIKEIKVELENIIKEG